MSFADSPELFSSSDHIVTDTTGKKVKKKKKKRKELSVAAQNHAMVSVTFGDDSAPLVTAFQGENEQNSLQKTKKKKPKKKLPEPEENHPNEVLDMPLNKTELEKVNKEKKHRQKSENQETTAEVSELSEPHKIKKKKKKKKHNNDTVMVLPTEHLTESSLGENSVTVEHDTESSVRDASTAEGGGQKDKKKRRTEQHPHPTVTAATPVLGEMEEQKTKRRRTEQLPDSPAPVVGETEEEVKKKKKKKKRITEQLPDSPAPVVGETEEEVKKKKKKKKTRRRTEQLSDSPAPVVGETEEEVKKKKKKKRITEQLPDYPAPIVEETEEEVKKKKKKKKITEQLPNSPAVGETEKVKRKKRRRTGPLPDSPAPVVEETDEEEVKRKTKRRRSEQLLDSPAPVVGETEEEKKEVKKRTEQLPDSPAVGETEKEVKRKKRRRTEQLPDSPAPVVGETEEEKEVKKRTEQLPDSPAVGETEKEVKKRKKRRRTEQLPDSPAVGETEEEVERRTEQLPDSPAVGETEKEVERRTEQLPDSPAVGEPEKEVKRRRTEQLPDSPAVGEPEKEVKKRKRRRTEQLPDSPAVGEPEEEVERRTEQLPHSPAPVVGETESKGQTKEKQKNGEHVVIEVVTERKKRKPGATGVADGRMSERQTDGEESHTSTRENGTQHEAVRLKVENEIHPNPIYAPKYGEAIDEAHIEELKEFIPNIRSKSPEQIQKLIKYDLERFKDFKSQGIPLRSGWFTDEENERLTKNMTDFLALTGIESATHLFFPQRFKDDHSRIKDLRSQHRFHLRIAEGIPRPWHLVYQRGRKMFDSYNYKGRYTEEENDKLKQFQTLYGNNWQKIAQVMDRSSASLEKRFAHIGTNSGPWIMEETDRLMDALRDHLRGVAEPGEGNQTDRDVISKEKLYKDIPWTDISYKVQTRNWTQCRTKWMCFLKQKMTPRLQAVFSKSAKGTRSRMDLIERLYAMQAQQAMDIDWAGLAESIGNVTPYYAQKEFHRLKVTRVPLWDKMTHCDIVDFMYEKVRPVLEESLKKGPWRRQRLEQSSGPTEHFLLSDIFSKDWVVDNV